MSQRSDKLYKQLFAHPEIVRDLLSGFLTADWARALNIRAFERVNASYISDGGKARHDDMVWRVRIGGDWVYVYILLEFQTRPDKWMALRMQVYIGLLYQDLVAQHKLSKHGKLPPVLPVVLYHGRQPWNAATELTELMLSPPQGLENYQARQHYLLIDQHHGVHGNIIGLLFRLLQARSQLELDAAVLALTQWLRQPDLHHVTVTLRRWLQFTLQDDFDDTKMDQEEGEMMRSGRNFKLADVFTDEFFDRLFQPLEEAKQEGVQQGERQALQGVLSDLIEAGDTPADAANRIAEADSDQLRLWIKSLARGTSPRQLFAEG